MRVEDVAIGFAISLGVGAAVLAARRAPRCCETTSRTAFARGSDYVVATARQLIDGSRSRRGRARGAQPRTRPSTGSTMPSASISPSARPPISSSRTVAAFVGGAVARPPGGAVARRARQHGRLATRLQRCGDNLDRRAPRAAVVVRHARICDREPGGLCRRRTSATPRAAAACSSACATPPHGDDGDVHAPRSCCCGRASISTTSGGSRPISANVRTPHAREGRDSPADYRELGTGPCV